MMSLLLSIVVGFRDRDLGRVHRCLGSLARQDRRDFELLLVDYGSQASTASALRQAVRGYKFARLIYSETRGYPWNRSNALNVAIREARGEYVTTTDIDMIFPKEFIRVLAEELRSDRVLYCYHHFLPNGFNDWDRLDAYRNRLPLAGTTAYGACQTASVAAMTEVRGFDEVYCYWGVEDRDLNHRLRQYGLAEHWINDRTAMFHQWHPTADVKTAGFLPAGLWGRMEQHWLERRDSVVRNDEKWGRMLAAHDRPAFAFVDPDEGRLRKRADLHCLTVNPFEAKAVSKVLQSFWDLPPGHALAVSGASRPTRRRWVDHALRVGNAFLRRLANGPELGYRLNAVHTFLAELVHERPPALADYYLNLPQDDGFTVLVRAESQ